MKGPVIASPSIRALARRKGIDIDALAAELGREAIAREDVERKAAGNGAPTSAGSQAASYWDVDHAAFGPVSHEPMSRFARVAAANMTAAQARIPAVTHHDRADMRAVEAFRAKLKQEAALKGVRLTALAFHVKALAAALRAFPRFNASLKPDGETLVVKHYVHIGVAVDTEHGLIVPAIRDADRKRLWTIAAQVADLAARARGRRIRPQEMGGVSMTITNLGRIGGLGFTPIVNPPEVAILGISRTETAPVWDGEIFRPVPFAPLDLSYDHRVINGAEAARFLVHYARLVADPRRLML